VANPDDETNRSLGGDYGRPLSPPPDDDSSMTYFGATIAGLVLLALVLGVVVWHYGPSPTHSSLTAPSAGNSTSTAPSTPRTPSRPNG
jgi:hypothetical protein